MRVALIPSAYAPAVGGVEELTRRIAHHLERDHDVEVWTIRHPARLPREEEIEGVCVRRFDMPLPAARPARLLSFPPRATRAALVLTAAARSFRPDILHVQCFSANGLYAAFLSRLLRVPLVLTLQGETFMDDRDIYEHSVSLRAGLRAGLREAAVVTGCSAFVVDDAVRRFGLKPGTAHVIPNGIDVDGDPRPTPLHLPFGRFVLGLGRLVDKKGFDLLIDAFARLENRADLGLVIGGDGPALGRLHGEVRRRGLDNRVVLPGMLSRGQVAWAMRNAALFVMPSRVEPFGIVMLESMLAGCPVIASSRGGASDVIRNGRDGLLVDPLDVQAVADTMERVLRERELRDRLVESGRWRVSDFTWDAIIERYLDAYRQATEAQASTLHR